MVFYVKVKAPPHDWEVVYDVEERSFGEAERVVKEQYARQKGVRLSDVDAKAYRADAKSVWKHR